MMMELAKKFKVNKKLCLYFIGIIAAALFITLPYVASRYIVTLVFLMFVYIGYAEAWNIMTGFTGYVNFGNVLFIGAGGYASVILIMDYGLWPPIGWILGGIFSSILAVIIGSFMLRLRGSYFAIGMLCLLLAAPVFVATEWLKPITRGGFGFQFIQPVSTTTIYYVAGVVTATCIFVAYKIITSGFGARLLAIREDEEGAGSIGINTTKDKISAFAISCFFAGLIGSIHISFQNYIDPHSAFNLWYNILPIAMVLLGGLGTVWGPVLGAIIMTFVEEFLWVSFPELYYSIYGIIIVVLVLAMPGGIVTWLKSKRVLPRMRAI